MNILSDTLSTLFCLADIQKQVAARIADVSMLLNNVKNLTSAANIPSSSSVASSHVEKKKAVAYRPLLLDDQGREIDEQGNLVKWQADTLQIKTLAANVAVANAMKKKENPYLAHRQAPNPAVLSGDSPAPLFEDPRLAHLVGTRESKAKKAFQFIEAGIGRLTSFVYWLASLFLMPRHICQGGNKASLKGGAESDRWLFLWTARSRGNLLPSVSSFLSFILFL